MDTNVTFQRLSGRYRQEAVKYLICEEKDGHVRTRNSRVDRNQPWKCMAGFYQILEACGKST